MELTQENREKAWLLLADLFFLDIEADELDFQRAAERLAEIGIKQEEAGEILVQEVAPVAGSNLGYLIWPVIGIWSGFDAADLCGKIGAHVKRRAARPQWRYVLHDRFMRWMVRQLEPERLWSQMQNAGNTKSA
jgi:hypothetical protein